MNDDAFSRRGALRRLSLLTLAAGCDPAAPTPTATPDDDDAGDDDSADTCVVAPEQTQGPFYFDANLVRRDITEGRPGFPTTLTLTVLDAACAPIRDAVVDLWHADADGVYSGYTGQGHDGVVDTTGQTFLRGVQVTDAQGRVTFETIFPGWYPGRATHMHWKVHLGGQNVATSQLYFPDAVSDAVHVLAPYDVWGPRDTLNAQDNFGGDSPIVLTTAEVLADRVSARLRVVVDG